MNTFKYKRIGRKERLPIVNPEPPVVATDDYSGIIDGLVARHGEENLLKAAYKSGRLASYQFRLPVGAPRGFPGWKELDFLFQTKTGEYVAVQVKDYEFVHHGQSITASDLSDDAYMLQEFAKQGIPLKGNKIYSVSNNDVDTVDNAMKVIEAIL